MHEKLNTVQKNCIHQKKVCFCDYHELKFLKRFNEIIIKTLGHSAQNFQLVLNKKCLVPTNNVHLPYMYSPFDSFYL